MNFPFPTDASVANAVKSAGTDMMGNAWDGMAYDARVCDAANAFDAYWADGTPDSGGKKAYAFDWAEENTFGEEQLYVVGTFLGNSLAGFEKPQ